MTDIEKLKELLDVQTRDGNWDYDPYMHGLANGLILALSVLMKERPKFLSAPKTWGRDAKDIEKPAVQGAVYCDCGTYGCSKFCTCKCHEGK